MGVFPADDVYCQQLLVESRSANLARVNKSSDRTARTDSVRPRLPAHVPTRVTIYSAVGFALCYNYVMSGYA